MSENKKRKKKKDKTLTLIRTALIVILAGVFIYSAWQLTSTLLEYHKINKTNDNIRVLFEEGNAGEDDSTLHQGSEAQIGTEANGVTAFSRLEAVRQVNEDTVAWIVMDGIEIELPIVQAHDNDYYLRRNFYKESSMGGTLFLDYNNRLDCPCENLVVYGHRMKNGSMFGRLGKYLERDFFEANPTFTLYLDDGEYECQIFSVYQCTTDRVYALTTFGSESSFLSYVERARGWSKYHTDIEITGEDRIITLSTCDYELDPDDGRLVVSAKLVKIGD